MTANDIHRAQGASHHLDGFNEAGVLSPADVHIASTLTRLVSEERPELALLAALTVRAVRMGSVCLDLSGLPAGSADPRASDWDLPADQWPEVEWVQALAGSPLVTARPAPLALDGPRAYLRRYWQEETWVLQELLARLPERTRGPAAGLDGSLDEYFPDPGSADQRHAAEVLAGSTLAIITGGPGSGKTTTVARALGVILDQDPAVRVGLAAPTGKAAARMVEALHQATTGPDFPATHAQTISGMNASTIHRMLGYTPEGTYRHDRENPLPYDLVIIDEASMVSLTLMSRLLDAVPPEATLAFVGDADQLASVEVGAVFADLVEGLRTHPRAPVAELTRSRRFGKEIGAMAHAVKRGDATAVAGHLHSPAGEEGTGALAPLRIEELLEELMPVAERLYSHGTQGRVREALDLLQTQQLLCAHRDGLFGARRWNEAIMERLSARVGTHLGEFFPGQPLVVLKNDYSLGIFNGDTGVVMDEEGRSVVAFAQGKQVRLVPLGQISDVIPAYAITVHRSQGSQFQHVYVLLPEQQSRILTRELLYTALTRAQRSVRIIGAEAALTAAVTRRVERASGLVARLRTA